MHKLLMLFLVPTLLFAHAHIFIDYEVHGISNEKGMQGLYVNWSFDRMFTAMITKDYDKNSDWKLSKEEQKEVYKNSFLKWKEDDFYCVLKLNGKKLKLPTVQKFSARLNSAKEIVQFTFYIPLNIPATEKDQTVSIHFIDKVIYIDFTTSEKKITMKNKTPEKITLKKSYKEVKYTKQAHYTFSKSR